MLFRKKTGPYHENSRSRSLMIFIVLLAVYALSAFGILCISMATYDVSISADASLLTRIMNSRSSMWQTIFYFASFIVVAVALNLHTDLIRDLVPIIYLIILGMLAITLVVGSVSNGLKGWLESSILGRSVQPCEFCKLSTILILAKRFSSKPKPMSTLEDFFITMALVGIPCLIVLLQGETGSVIVVVVIFMIMLFFSGADIKLIITFCVLGALFVGALFAYGLTSGTTDYRILRLMAFLNPKEYSSSGGYQILQSQTAIGSGNLTGVGTFLTGSMTTLGFVPESSTDSIFSVVGESFGFIGCAAVLLTYLFIILYLFYMAQTTADPYGRLVIIGVMGMIFFHVFQNVAMSIGYMPITGIPLPFLSYGGSNFITNIGGISLALNVVKYRTSAEMVTNPITKDIINPNERAKEHKPLFGLMEKIFG